jgi:hypothetical protein
VTVLAQAPSYAAAAGAQGDELGPEPAGERATLLDYLRFYRLTMEMKYADLHAAQLG